jgi:LytS/YehU family sensor histidine kinase
VVEVEDDGVGLGASAAALIDDDHGLGNVRRRLAAQYGGEAGLELGPSPGGRGALSRLRIPIARTEEGKAA